MTARICPDDGSKLVEIDRHGVIIDFCPTCHGAWFDVSELEEITEYAARRLARLKIETCGRDLESLSDTELNQLFHRQFNLPVQTPLRFCPCEGVGLEHKRRHDVTVDWCPLCRGIWCDRGELDAIVHMTAHQLVMTRCLHTIEKGELPLPRDIAVPTPLPVIDPPSLTVLHQRPPPAQAVADAVQLHRLLNDKDQPRGGRVKRVVAGLAIGAKVAEIAIDILSG